jgi:hypothetical protein
MANVQPYLVKFHEMIRADLDMNATLRDKRDIVLRRIAKHLNEHELPGFEELGQGSYTMKTGTVPTPGLKFDIDVGLRFFFRESEYASSTVREWVFDAVEDHTETVEAKGPCIRVTYADGYHVDLVCYAVFDDDYGVEQYRLAHKHDDWCPTDPPKLLEHVRNARKPFGDTKDALTGTDQFRRVVRYLKRWNDVAIPTERKDKPTGLAFTLLCCSHLMPRTTLNDSDDRAALSSLARMVGQQAGRIEAKKPTPGYEDMFSRLNDGEMAKLKARFSTLADTLDAAGAEPDPVAACMLLRKVFGDEFPVPAPDATGKKSGAPAILTSSASA